MKNQKDIPSELKKLIAYELSQLHPQGSIEAATRMIGEARIDPNPHQIEAAIYGYKALQRNGAILADEVGLGKTIEAGLIINQYWAEGKRRVLIVAPVALRAQWQKELDSLFYLPSQVLTSQEWKGLTKSKRNPIARGEAGIFIVSDHLIVNNHKIFASSHWDLVIIDEAHRLRNVYRKGKNEALQAKRMRDTLASAPKLLLTATPFQNSLDELYGLISMIDQNYFGSFESFQRLYSKPSKHDAMDPAALRVRIDPIFRRTLRNEVAHYLKYTERKPVTMYYKYDATSEEGALHADITTLLTSNYLLLNSKTSRGFFDLIYLKLLGSSPFALNPALLKLPARFLQGLVKRGAEENVVKHWIARVKEIFDEFPQSQSHFKELAQITCKSDDISFHAISTYLVKHENEEEDPEVEDEHDDELANNFKQKNNDLSALKNEALIVEQLKIIVKNYYRTHQAHITGRAKVFIEAIQKHITQAKQKGFQQKAVVFTEYMRTLTYVSDLLNRNGFEDYEVIVYHGGISNSKGSDGLSDRDRAIERFRMGDKAILIATEAGAEGLNLQFCNLVVNYDLPWNPQRIEQRIGRCHRYGQKNDVIVVNFVCEDNSAEQHIFRILSEKFKLFHGVFGASNSILGAMQSGAELEKIFGDIYLGIRSTKEAESDLDSFLQTSAATRKDGIREVAKKLLEEFDPDVTKILKVEWARLKDEVTLNLTLHEKKLAALVRSEIEGEFVASKSVFEARDKRFPALSARKHTLQRVYATDDLPLITPRHGEVIRLIDEWKNREVFDENSYIVSLPEDLRKMVGNLQGPGHWLYCIQWRIIGASTFEHIQAFILQPNGNIIDAPGVRSIIDQLDCSTLQRVSGAPSENEIKRAIDTVEDTLQAQREEIGQQVYVDRIASKQKAKYEQDAAADILRSERRQISSEFDLAILKAPMKEKNKVMKERDAKLRDLDKELTLYSETVTAIEEQEKNLHRELTAKHTQGNISRTILFKVHLEFT